MAEKVIRIADTDATILREKIREFLMGQIHRVVNTSTVGIVTKTNKSTVFRNKTGTDEITINFYSDTITSRTSTVLKCREGKLGAEFSNEAAYNQTSQQYSVDFTYIEEAGLFVLLRATLADDTVYSGGESYYGYVFFTTTLDGENEWIDVKTQRYSDESIYVALFYINVNDANIWSILSNYAIPDKQVALFNYGDGKYFYPVYKHSSRSTLSLPNYSTQEVAGLGKFTILSTIKAGTVWIKEG